MLHATGAHLERERSRIHKAFWITPASGVAGIGGYCITSGRVAQALAYPPNGRSVPEC